MEKVKHLLGISGGKDSAALSIYMSQKYPTLDIEYYTCDTGKELKETYDLIGRLNSVLGKDIELYKSMDEDNSPMKNPFDHFLAMYGGYLPSATARWCTGKMKLQPFEAHVGDEPTISYVGIRGDENREGYISKRENIQTIFPFRKNIWSEDVIKKVLVNSNMTLIKEYYKDLALKEVLPSIMQYVEQPISPKFTQLQKLNALMDIDLKLFNKVVFEFLKTTDYPIGKLDEFPLIENDEIIGVNSGFRTSDDIYRSRGLYLIPEKRGEGLSNMLLKLTIQTAKQQECKIIWTMPRKDALFAYESVGFRKIGGWIDKTVEFGPNCIAINELL